MNMKENEGKKLDEENKNLLDWTEEQGSSANREGIQITPVDIRHQHFKKKLSGYDTNEVNSFLEQVAADYEKIFMQRNMLVKQLGSAKKKLKEYKEKEKTMNETMLSAQKYVSDLKQKSKQQQDELLRTAKIDAENLTRNVKENADLLMKETVEKAKNEAIDIITKGKVEYEKMKEECERLRNHRDDLKEKFREAIKIIKEALNPNEK